MHKRCMHTCIRRMHVRDSSATLLLDSVALSALSARSLLKTCIFQRHLCTGGTQLLMVSGCYQEHTVTRQSQGYGVHVWVCNWPKEKAHAVQINNKLTSAWLFCHHSWHVGLR
jgi:hypothetical protein